MKLWHVEKGTLKRTVSHDDGWGVVCVVFSPDGQKVATASWDNSVRILDVQSGELTRQLVADDRWLFVSVAFSPSGKTIAGAGGKRDEQQFGKIKLWATDTGRLKETLDAAPAMIRSVAFSPDGQTLAGASERFQKPNAVMLWDLSQLKP